mgnify:CR=1 FL=1
MLGLDRALGERRAGQHVLRVHQVLQHVPEHHDVKTRVTQLPRQVQLLHVAGDPEQVLARGLLHHQRDRVGFIAFDNDVVEHVPPSAKHMETVLHVLDRLQPGRPGSLRRPLHKLAEHFGRRGVLVVISAFSEDPEAVIEAVTPLRFRGNDLVVFHVLDPAELDFGFSDASAFEDLESGEQMPVVPDAMRKEYVSLVNAHIDALQQRFSEVRVDYTLLDTSKPLDHALFKYLSSREKKLRVR